MRWPFTLRTVARDDGYIYFDAHIRKLPRNSDGSFNEFDPIFVNSDVDAFRHAYVSGIFTHEYGANAADWFGRLNELFPSSSGNSAGEDNMDLWNNAVGRKYAKKFKKSEDLLKGLHEALKKGELIVSPDDTRVYEGASHTDLDTTHPVIVLGESQSGRNEFFYDFADGKVLDRSEFVNLIKGGKYPGYLIRNINDVETPISKPNHSEADNLS
jgi:hypothetical protein